MNNSVSLSSVVAFFGENSLRENLRYTNFTDSSSVEDTQLA